MATATSKGDIWTVQTFLDAWPADAYDYGPILVDVAANERKYDIWQLLIDYKICEVNWKRPSGYSPLMEAILVRLCYVESFAQAAGLLAEGAAAPPKKGAARAR